AGAAIATAIVNTAMTSINSISVNPAGSADLQSAVSQISDLLARRFPNGVSNSAIPKGLSPPAQGCEERATLGNRPVHNKLPRRGCGKAFLRPTQPLRGRLPIAG